MESWIGLAGWSYADWDGRVYPRPKPAGFDPLAWLAAYVDLMEINSTFYAHPDPRHVAGWLERTAHVPRFSFIAKLHGDFTHGHLDRRSRRAAQEGLAPLVASERLLTLLAQFPWSQRPDESGWARLTQIREAFPGVPVHVEPRHRSWFEDPVFRRLEDLSMQLVHIDLPAARDHPPAEHPTLGPLGYLRLHGRNARAWFDRNAGRDARYDYRYSPEELQGVKERLAAIQERTSRTAVVMNNHYGGKALAAALELRALIGDKPVRAPGTLLDTYPDLADRLERDGQQTLF